MVLVAQICTGRLAASVVKGAVQDAQTNAPLPSMIVAAYDSSGFLQANATTDTNGRYALNLSDGTYRLLAYDANGTYATTFASDAESFETTPLLSVLADVSGVDFALRRGGTVMGTVVNVGSGGLIAGATVAAYNLSGTRRAFTTSNGFGAFSLVLPPGQYKIASYDNSGVFSVRFYLDQSTFDSATTVSVTGGHATVGIDFRLDVAGRLSGAVTDFDSHALLPGMSVIAFTERGVAMGTTSTDVNGRFSLSVPAGTYKIVATDERLTFATGFLGDTNSFAHDPPISVAAGEIRTDVDLALHRAGKTAGTVSGANGNTLSKMTVAAYNEDGTQRTTARSDTYGAYVLALPPGTFRIAAYDESLIFATQFYPQQRTFASAAPVTVASEVVIDHIDFSLDHGARVSGVITDNASGKVVQGIAVAAYDAEGDNLAIGVSGANGTYSLIVPAGTYKFVAYDTAYQYATAYTGGASTYEEAPGYTVQADISAAVDFTVSKGLRVPGSVIDARRVSISGVEIDALDLQGRHVAVTPVDGGTFSLVLLPASYKLQVIDRQKRYYDMYYNSASTFGAAATVTVSTSTPPDPITFILSHRQRRHSAGR